MITENFTKSHFSGEKGMKTSLELGEEHLESE